MAGPSSLLASDLSSGLEAAVRTARKVDLSDSLDAIRTDVGERVEVGRELVGDAAESVGVAVARMQGRSQGPSRRRLALIGLAIGIVGVIALAAWWRRRHAMDGVVDDEARDRDLLDRAADDGMGAAIGSPTLEQASGTTARVTRCAGARMGPSTSSGGGTGRSSSVVIGSNSTKSSACCSNTRACAPLL